jgi:hypothetical protein
MAEAHVKRALPSLIGGIFTAIVAWSGAQPAMCLHPGGFRFASPALQMRDCVTPRHR